MVIPVLAGMHDLEPSFLSRSERFVVLIISKTSEYGSPL